MPIERSYITFYLFDNSIAMVAIFVIVCEIVVEMCMTLTLTFKIGQGQK